MQFAGPYKPGRNASANEENPDHCLPALGHDRHTGIRGGGNRCLLSLARVVEGPKDSPESPAPVRLVPHRNVLQPVSPRRHRRGHHEKLLPAERDAGQKSGRTARGIVRSVYRPCCVGRNYGHAHCVALRFPFTKTRDTKLALAVARPPWRLGHFFAFYLCHQWIQTLTLFAGTIPRPRQVNRDLRRLSSVRASLARNTRRV